MSNNLKIIKISDLPDSSSVESTYFFGYDADPEKPLNEQSVKIPFLAVAKASTERRIALVMETSSQIIPIGEKMKITKNICKNVATLEIKPNDSRIASWTPIPLNSNTEVDLSNYAATNADALIRISHSGTDPISTIYLFTKILE